MDRDELVEAVFSGELRAAEVRALAAALERRFAGLRQARRRGEPVDVDELDEEQYAAQLAVLREEELIAQFIEDSLADHVGREQILAQLDELAAE